MPIIETLKPPGFVLRVSIHKKNPRKISIAIVVARFSNARYKKISASNSKSLLCGPAIWVAEHHQYFTSSS